MGYSRKISNYSKKITLFDLPHLMSMTDFVAICVEVLRIDSGYFLEKQFTELIHINSLMVIIPYCHST